MRSSMVIKMVLFSVLIGITGCAGQKNYEKTDVFTTDTSMKVVEETPVRKPVWSPWAKLDDGGLNGIEFSHKDDCATQGSSTPCSHSWRFNSLYETDVDIEYTIAWDSGAGLQKKTARSRVKPGVNSDNSFAVNAIALDELSVRLIADATVLADARNTVAEISAEEQREIARKQKQAELVARLAAEELQRQEEARRQQEEAARRQQAADADYWRQHPEEYQARLAQQRYQEQERQRQEQRRADEAEYRRRQAREEEAEQRRQDREEAAESRRRSEQSNRDFNSALRSGLQSMQSSINQGMNTYNNAAQINRDVDAQIRRDRENREREAREQQRRQAEDAAQQRRDAQENQRIERQRIAKQEDDRRAEESRRRDEQARKQREAEVAEQERQAKNEVEKERKRKENSGRWVDASYKVTAWGSDKMYLETYVNANVVDSKGSGDFKGQYLSLQSGSSKYSAQYATVSGIRGTLAPGETKLIHIPFNNGTGDSYRPTEYPVNIRYFKED